MRASICTATANCTRLAPARARGCQVACKILQQQSRAVRAAAATTEAAAPKAGIPAEKLIEWTKDYQNKSQFGEDEGGGLAYQEEIMAEDYVFRGPAIGPFIKSDYIKSISKVTVKSAFPDMKFRTWGYSVDPENPMRVWYFAQVSGTMTKDWEVNGQFFPATGKPIKSGPEAHSVEWTSEGKVRYQSVGYCVDRIYSDTPDGSMTVAVFAAFVAADKPWVVKILLSPLWEWFKDKSGDPQATRWENLPEWYKKLPGADLKGAQGYFRV